MNTQPTVVWAEIPVKDLNAAIRFYDSVFDWKTEIDRSAPFAVLNGSGSATGVGANLFQTDETGKRGNIIHFAVADTCEAAAERLRAAGGEVLGEAVEIPPGRFIMALDIDGNQIGLFQPRAA
ncbi:VOC family protein [uncultured Maritimibacter sp.]|jgi:predicted enzyme related to lactoylglutathione lyase|uniref:VOC family protein n=1 Tax=uncultured Maritimibacter sp. TaxID=991866 RepID=UPI00262C891B|nr:VOC family protein [uncultured Maritimibacter sp.]